MLDAKSSHPLHVGVAELIKAMIESGQLNVGDKIPSLRKMSQQAKVSISTAIQAYANLEDQAVIESRPKSGYYVTAQSASAIELPDRIQPGHKTNATKSFNVWGSIYESVHKPEIVPLGLANPSADLLPTKALNRSIRKVLNEQAERTLEYSFPPGELALRQQIANHYTRLNQYISPDDIVITNGATEALMISLKAVAKAGDVIAVESPVYFVILRIIQSLGMTVLEIESDPKTGISVESLEKAIQSINITAVIVIPNFSNPSGALMPDEKKQCLVNLLDEKQITLIEDDVYGELYFGPHRPSNCREFSNNGKVMLCSSFSKSIAPGYRIGWVIPGQFRERVFRQKRLSSAATGTLSQLAIADFIQAGTFNRHMRKLRLTYRDQLIQMRTAIAATMPKGTRITNPVGGFILWAQLPGKVDTLKLAEAALQTKHQYCTWRDVLCH